MSLLLAIGLAAGLSSMQQPKALADACYLTQRIADDKHQPATEAEAFAAHAAMASCVSYVQGVADVVMAVPKYEADGICIEITGESTVADLVKDVSLQHRNPGLNNSPPGITASRMVLLSMQRKYPCK